MAGSISIIDGGSVNRAITAFRVIDGGSVDRLITEARAFDSNGVDRLFYNPSGSATLSVSVSLSSVHGTSTGTGNVTTNSTTATATSGTSPYTYAWTLDSYDGPVPPTANSPTSAATTFTQTSVGVSEVYTSTWAVTATDSLGNTATAQVIANFADAS